MKRDAGAPRWSGVLLGGPEMALNPRLSPDGNLLAFKAFDNTQAQVGVMKPESGNWTVLTHHRDRGVVDLVTWSPDGSSIYYGRTTDVPHGIYSVPVLGGEEHLVVEDANLPEALPDGSLLITRLNPAGRALLRWRLQGPGLYAIDLADQMPVTAGSGLSKQKAAALQAWTVSRDGKTLVVALPAGSMSFCSPTGELWRTQALAATTASRQRKKERIRFPWSIPRKRRPVTLAGHREIAFVLGPAPHSTLLWRHRNRARHPPHCAQ